MIVSNPQRILLTGGAGFVGSNVVRVLRERYPQAKLRVMHLPRENLLNLKGMDEVELVAGDVLKQDEVDRAVAGCDVVFHLAAIYAVWLPDMSLIGKVNVEGTRNVLESCLKQGVKRVVHTSSAVCYCGHGPDVVCTEESPFAMHGSHYAESKFASHKVAQEYAKKGLDVVIVCPVGPVGPGDVGPTPTGRMIAEAFHMPVKVAMRSRMNLIDVRDCAVGHVLALEKGRTGESYLLGGEIVWHRELLERALRVSGRSARVFEVNPKVLLPYAYVATFLARFTKKAPLVTPMELHHAGGGLVCDAAKARRELGLVTRPLDETLRDALSWFATHGYLEDAELAARFSERKATANP